MGFLPVVSFLDQGSFHGWPGKPALRAPRVYLGKETDLCPNKLVLGQPCPRPEFVCIRDCVSRGEIGVGGATHPLGEASVSQSLVGPPPVLCLCSSGTWVTENGKEPRSSAPLPSSLLVRDGRGRFQAIAEEDCLGSKLPNVCRGVLLFSPFCLSLSLSLPPSPSVCLSLCVMHTDAKLRGP